MIATPIRRRVVCPAGHWRGTRSSRAFGACPVCGAKLRRGPGKSGRPKGPATVEVRFQIAQAVADRLTSNGDTASKRAREIVLASVEAK